MVMVVLAGWRRGFGVVTIFRFTSKRFKLSFTQQRAHTDYGPLDAVVAKRKQSEDVSAQRPFGIPSTWDPSSESLLDRV